MMAATQGDCTTERRPPRPVVPRIDPSLLVAARKNQQKATTYLTQKDGSRWKVERDLQGNEIITPVQPYHQSQFFVIDEKPDTAVCTVIPGLHIGSQDAATNWEELKEKGVTHILNVAFYISNPFGTDFILETVEVVDEPDACITKFFPRCFDFINTARRSGGGVLVHCNAGISRSSTVLAAYLMHEEGYTLENALTTIRAARPMIRPNDGFMKELTLYEASLKH